MFLSFSVPVIYVIVCLCHGEYVSCTYVAPTGCTPLHLAIAGGHTQVVEILLPLYEDLTKSDREGLTSLHYAVLTGHESLATLLINELTERCQELDTPDRMGFTALHWAVALDREDIILALIEHGKCFCAIAAIISFEFFLSFVSYVSYDCVI